MTTKSFPRKVISIVRTSSPSLLLIWIIKNDLRQHQRCWFAFQRWKQEWPSLSDSFPWQVWLGASSKCSSLSCSRFSSDWCQLSDILRIFVSSPFTELCPISNILWYCWVFPASPCRLIHRSSFSVSCYCSGFLAMGSSFPISLQILCVCGIEKMSSASDIERNIVEWKTWVFTTFCVELCAFIDWVYQRGIQWRIALKQKHGTNSLSYLSMQYCQN